MLTRRCITGAQLEKLVQRKAKKLGIIKTPTSSNLWKWCFDYKGTNKHFLCVQLKPDIHSMLKFSRIQKHTHIDD